LIKFKFLTKICKINKKRYVLAQSEFSTLCSVILTFSYEGLLKQQLLSVRAISLYCEKRKTSILYRCSAMLSYVELILRVYYSDGPRFGKPKSETTKMCK